MRLEGDWQLHAHMKDFCVKLHHMNIIQKPENVIDHWNSNASLKTGNMSTVLLVKNDTFGASEETFQQRLFFTHRWSLGPWPGGWGPMSYRMPLCLVCHGQLQTFNHFAFIFDTPTEKQFDKNSHFSPFTDLLEYDTFAFTAWVTDLLCIILVSHFNYLILSKYVPQRQCFYFKHLYFKLEDDS